MILEYSHLPVSPWWEEQGQGIENMVYADRRLRLVKSKGIESKTACALFHTFLTFFRMFYFFFESRNTKNDPVVIWLTGGPGCSSELAIFYENGPFSIANNLSLLWNDYGWDKVQYPCFIIYFNFQLFSCCCAGKYSCCLWTSWKEYKTLVKLTIIYV